MVDDSAIPIVIPPAGISKRSALPGSVLSFDGGLRSPHETVVAIVGDLTSENLSGRMASLGSTEAAHVQTRQLLHLRRCSSSCRCLLGAGWDLPGLIAKSSGVTWFFIGMVGMWLTCILLRGTTLHFNEVATHEMAHVWTGLMFLGEAELIKVKGRVTPESSSGKTDWGLHNREIFWVSIAPYSFPLFGHPSADPQAASFRPNATCLTGAECRPGHCLHLQLPLRPVSLRPAERPGYAGCATRPASNRATDRS